ncbi:energy transducer TonB [Zestomonas carbonaria]|uniref:Protein TonB n=1 Tax=Zestomonas carbonaria TaxID=2762745 RepID=A0A7U7EKJ1_9GAMM|nr:energy transducer TonB [Pseudomonas carbonaria]CAD5106635.1 hypothetical protein PSEWESI4_00901 [Pseudomonas carbonaria]
MSVLVMDDSSTFSLAPSYRIRWRNAVAALLAVGLHGLVLALLMAGWKPEPPAEPSVRVLTTQLVSLPTPTPPAPPAPVEPAVVPPSEPVAEPDPAPRGAPAIEQQKLEQAALARKRLEEEQRHERLAEQRRQRERERREAERRAVEAERQAEMARRAQESLLAAERARQAEAAAAASRQYLPIVKQAPDYPQRALDRSVQGDCTVEYRVNPQGGVEEPKVVGDCHPLFVRPSLAAALKFRYQPRVIDGRPVAVPGVRNTFHYRIER